MTRFPACQVAFVIFGKSSQSDRFEYSSRPRSSFANSCSQKARLSCSSSSSSPAARHTGSGHSTMNVDIRSSYGYACALKRPCSVSRKANVNASKTWSVPNQTYFEPSGRTFVPKSPNRRRRLFAPSAPTTRSASGSSSTSTPNSSDDAQLAAPFLQDLEQPLARDRRERVAARRQLAPLVADVDAIPARERVRDLEVRLGIGVPQRAERLLAEDDAEAEGRVGRVPLEDADVGAPVELAQQDREIEARRPAADDRDVHASASWSRSSSSISATVGKRTSSSHPASS